LNCVILNKIKTWYFSFPSTLISIILFILFIGRPLINEKLEDKDCGDGPNLESIFEDDHHLDELQKAIKVRR